VIHVDDAIDIPLLRSRADQTAPEQIREELEVPAAAMLVVMAGNIRGWKGQNVALEALAHLSPEDRKEIFIAFAGKTTPDDLAYEASLHALVERHDLHGSVRFLGFRSDIPSLFRASDVVLHCSTIPEPGGTVVLEGMSLGRVVVASKIGGPAEFLTEGTGILYDTADPAALARILLQLARNPEKRRIMGERALARAEAFYSLPIMVRGMEEVYRSLVRPR